MPVNGEFVGKNHKCLANFAANFKTLFNENMFKRSCLHC